ncbi:MAG TPA: hypothetical protein VFD59_06250 [Nocardioidaceae bacterium]|nr:hypothetical protein [Nocardioidaceae bacterium]
MSPRATNLLAWSFFALYVLTVAATLGLAASGNGTEDAVLVVLAFGYAVVGALVAAKEPANAVGWLLLVTAVTYGLGNFAYEYGSSPGLPGEVTAAWFAGWTTYVPLYVAAMLLPLLFPTGRLLSPRWRAAVAVVLAALALTVLGAGLREGALDVNSAPRPSNPLGVGGPLGDVVAGASVLGGVLAVTGFMLGAFSLVLRLRRSRGRERQQLKVFAYVVVALLLDVLAFLAGGLAGPSAPSWVRGLNDLLWFPSLLLFTVGLPLAIGVAILRHRLYDIDVLINRTLVYLALTVTLAVSYLGSVLVLGGVLSPMTGESDLAVAASTLAVAALFGPARRRIQRAVDRRFYRRRYDASRTLDAFAGRLRDELGLETLAADLQQVTRDTLQPEHVSLWLRPSGQSRATSASS